MKFKVLNANISNGYGDLEISLSNFGYVGEKMSVRKSLLKGGSMACITSSCTIIGWRVDLDLLEILDNLVDYINEITK